MNQAYDKYVAEDIPSPVKVIDSEGGLIWKPTVYDMRTRLVDDIDSMYTDPSTLLGITALNHFISVGRPRDFAAPVVGDNPCEFAVAHSVSGECAGEAVLSPLCFIVPVSGAYSLLDSYTLDFNFF